MIRENLHKMASVLILGGMKHIIPQKNKGINLHVAYKTKYTSQPFLQPKPSIRKQKKYNHTSIYKLTCLDCCKIYIDQTENNS